MKTTTLMLFFFAPLIIHAQIPPATNQPITPGSPTQPIQPVPQPYNPTNPTGQPNQINPAPSVPPVPSGTINGRYEPIPNGTQPGNVQPLPPAPKNPANPASTYTPNNFNRLFQDPVRTPNNPKQVDPVRQHSGTNGKYHKPKKAMSGKTFAHNKIGVKKARTRGDNGRERSRSTGTTEGTR